MAKYHISPKTGNPNICRAKPGNCPLKTEDGSEPKHYGSKQEARADYEKQMEEKSDSTVKTYKKKKKAIEYGSEDYYKKRQEIADKDVGRDLEAPYDFSDHQFKALGKNVSFNFTHDAIYFKGKNGRELSFFVEGDCCSTGTINDVNMRPIDSPISHIVEATRFTSFYDGQDEKTVVWNVHYENGEVQSFEDVNLSNGYYSNMYRSEASFEVVDAFDEDVRNGESELWV